MSGVGRGAWWGNRETGGVRTGRADPIPSGVSTLLLSPPVRRVAERLARRVTVWRRLPAGFGPGRILVTPDAMLAVLKPRLEDVDPVLFDLARQLVRPGMRIWDIGADLGLFGFAAAWRAGRDGSVLLVEPDPGLCAVLERSVERLAGRGYAPTAIACCAALDRAGPVRFRIAARGRATNAVTGFGPGPRGGVRRTLVVGSTSLDGLLEAADPPDLVKLDTQGAELAVLRGAAAVLRRRPVLMVKVREQDATAMTALLLGAGYHLLDGGAGLRPVERCTALTVAIPEFDASY